MSIETKWTGKFLKGVLEKFVHNGVELNWEYVTRTNAPGAVLIVPYHKEKNSLVMIKEFRIPIHGYEYGFPAGLIDHENESIIEVAKRELFEETGLTLEKVYRSSVSPVYSSSGLTDESITIIYAEVSGDISKKHLQDHEDITQMYVSKHKLQTLLKDKTIKFGAKAWVICDAWCNGMKFENED